MVQGWATGHSSIARHLGGSDGRPLGLAKGAGAVALVGVSLHVNGGRAAIPRTAGARRQLAPPGRQRHARAGATARWAGTIVGRGSKWNGGMSSAHRSLLHKQHHRTLAPGRPQFMMCAVARGRDKGLFYNQDVLGQRCECTLAREYNGGMPHASAAALPYVSSFKK